VANLADLAEAKIKPKSRVRICKSILASPNADLFKIIPSVVYM
jgi:hypothetical protein